MSKPLRWICSQLGAREHYAVPRSLHRAGLLDRVCTDIWAGKGLRAFSSVLPGRCRALRDRWHHDLRDVQVESWNARALARQVELARNQNDRYLGFIEEGRWFSELVASWYKGGAKENQILFSYDTCALEAFRAVAERGGLSVLGQMDPARVEEEIVQQERELWQGWEPRGRGISETYHGRRSEEWDLAGRIVVNSVWSREALIKQGVSDDKVVIIPLAYERQQLTAPMRKESKRGTPLRVLFLGQVILRKGIPYLLEAARILGKQVEIRIVGRVGIAEEVMTHIPANVEFVGAVHRSRTEDEYHWADVFVLPTVSDGFALTQLEAMSYGLPVIATPCCGDVVFDKVNGALIPARDAEALAEVLSMLAADREILAQWSTEALKRVDDFSISEIGKLWASLGEKMNG